MNARPFLLITALGLAACAESVEVPSEPTTSTVAPTLTVVPAASTLASVPAQTVESALSTDVRSLAPAATQPRLIDVAQQARDVQFGGIGVVVTQVDGAIVIREVMEGFPADRAGLRAGQRVTEVDGLETEGMSVDQFVALVRGQEGAPVALTVAGENGAALPVTIAREVIQMTETRCDRIAQVRRQNEFASVGVEIEGGCGGAHVASVEPGLPADVAGIQAGDRIEAVDGMAVSGAHVLDIVGALRGDAGSTVRLSLVGADGTQRDVELERVHIVAPPTVGCGQ